MVGGGLRVVYELYALGLGLGLELGLGLGLRLMVDYELYALIINITSYTL